MALVVSDKADAFVLKRAARLNVPAVVVPYRLMADADAVMKLLQDNEIDFIALAGYLRMVPDYLIDAYKDKIVNIHPALLPKFGGRGMHGMNVHRAVKAAGESVSGITIHHVSPVCDGGSVIAAFEVALSEDDTPEDIATKVHELEMRHYPQVIEQLLTGKRG